ncbi:MAG TPA: hypothetical protein PK247_10880, partial [Candidatus Goldiibacteriota bacterium]|nr:hypothetical protein [Candidatus Goldiibacteriota bacterium]
MFKVSVIKQINRAIIAAVIFYAVIMPCRIFASEAFIAYDPAEKKFIYNSPEHKEILPELKKHAKKSALRGRGLYELSEKQLNNLKHIISPSIDIKKHTKASAVERRVKDNVLR